MDFNIRHAFITGIALNRNCADIIDEIYYSNEKVYYEAYLSDGLHSDYLKRMFSMKTEDRMNKLSGILEATKNNKDTLLLEKIIRKAHPSIVNFVKKSNIVDLDVFLRNYGIYNKNEEEQFSIYIALMYLAYKKNKEIRGSSSIYFITGKWNLYIEALQNNVYNLRELNVKEEDPKIVSFIKNGYKLLDMNEDENIDENLETFVSNFIEKATYTKMGVDYSNWMEEAKNISVEQYEDARHKVHKENGVVGYIGSFTRYMKLLGLDSSDMFVDVNIENFDLETIFKDCYYGITYNGVSDTESKLYIVACLFIYTLVQAYKECKDMYLNKLLEDKHKEINELESKIASKKKVIELEIAKHKKKNKELQDENKLLKEKLKELEKENARLSSKAIKDSEVIEDLTSKIKEGNDIIEDLKEECSTLLEISISKEDEITLENKIDYINQYKIGIFGGLSSIKSLANKLHNITFYNSRNQDISSIANLDAIFVSYEFFNHSFTKRINVAINKYDVKRGYISGTNDNLIIDAIYSQLVRINNL